ncbi:MAG TPA: GNAT family N-acetyltransferase [Terriglobales bacterium]|nr:GNAT family N-acetyltransferase [Terriglobales bacterium]
MSAHAAVGTAGKRFLLIIENRRQARAIERDWKRLYRECGSPNPFLSWEWQQAWLESEPPGVQPLIVAEAGADGSLAGLLALQRVRPPSAAGKLGLRQLEFLGRAADPDEMDCLAHPATDDGLAERLMTAALTRGGWELLRLEAARSDGSLARLWARLSHGFPAWGGSARVEAGDWLPYLPLPESFEAMLGEHSANFRSEVRRRRRAFARALPEARLECADTPGPIAGALDHLYRLHNLRRTQKNTRGIFEVDWVRTFHHELGRGLAARGEARVYLLRTRTEVIAGLYGFEVGGHGGRFLYYQSGFDQAFAGHSPGTVLLSGVMEDCIRRGLRQFEFLRGEEGYKARWTQLRRPTVNLMASRGVGRGWMQLRAAHARWRRPA